MSRIAYSEDEDRPGQFALWRANVARSLAGRRGQEALRDLESALLAMPEKRLVSHRLIDERDVCAVGALVVVREAKGRSYEEARESLWRNYVDCANDKCGHPFVRHKESGCVLCLKSVAWYDTFYQEHPQYARNDREVFVCMAFVHPDANDSGYWKDNEDSGEVESVAVSVGVPEKVAWRLVELNDMDLRDDTPEQRYEHVLSWVRAQLRMTPEQILRAML